jgi:hypothetical protein
MPAYGGAMANTATTTADRTMSGDTTSFTDLGKELWDYLTGRGAAINYQFVDMLVEVPRSTGASAPRATWRLHGTLRITTDENARKPA